MKSARTVERRDGSSRQDVLVLLNGDSASDALVDLNVRIPRPVIVIIGGADHLDSSMTAAIGDYLERAVAPVAAEASAIVLTGGTASGVMAAAGRAMGNDSRITLIGVAPAHLVAHRNDPQSGMVSLDENHHNFILANGMSWGSESETLFQLADEISAGRCGGVVILANGGAIARHETRRFLASGWPVISLQNTGRVADELAEQVRRDQASAARRVSLGLQPRISGSKPWGDLSGADVDTFNMPAGSAEALRRTIRWRISTEDIVKSAWSQYELYDSAARQAHFRITLLRTVLALFVGVVIVCAFWLRFLPPLVTYVLALTALSVTLATAFLDKLLPARRYVGYRVAAEAIRSAVWVNAGHATEGSGTAEGFLRQRVYEISTGLLIGGFTLPSKPSRGRPSCLSEVDDEFAPLTMRAYKKRRVEDQILYYRRRLGAQQVAAWLRTCAVLLTSGTVLLIEFHSGLFRPTLCVVGILVLVLVPQSLMRSRDQRRFLAFTISDLESICSSATANGLGVLDVVNGCEELMNTELEWWAQRRQGGTIAALMTNRSASPGLSPARIDQPML